AGPQQVDRSPAAEVVGAAVGREMPLIRTPAESARLRTLTAKPADRPGVAELAGFLGDRRALGSPSADVDALNPNPPGAGGPFAARRRTAAAEPGVGAEVEKRLLDEMRYEAGIGAVRHDRGRPRRITPANCQNTLAQRVI